MQLFFKMNEIGEILYNIEHPYKILDNVGLERLTTNWFVEEDVSAYSIRIGKYRMFVTIEWRQFDLDARV